MSIMKVLLWIKCCMWFCLGVQWSMARDMDHFDWRMYVELNPDLLRSGIKNEASAKKHYMFHGIQEGRPFPSLFPSMDTFDKAKGNLQRYVRNLNENNIPPERRTIIIYHLGRISPQNNLNVTLNSLNIFFSALMKDHYQNKVSKAFYWINLVNGTNHQLYSYLPSFLLKEPEGHEWNVGLVHWDISPSDMYLHIRTLDLLNSTNLIQSFQHTIVLNNDARGPLAHQERGEWIDKMVNAFSHPKTPANQLGKVGIVGSALSCEVKPHVQSHFFAIDNRVVPLLLAHYRYNNESLSIKHWLQLIMQYEIGLSQLLLRNGYHITALMYQSRVQLPYFDKKCIPPPITSTNGYHGLMAEKNPVRWCGIDYNEVLFLKWGGTPFRKQGMICTEMLKRMNRYLYKVQYALWKERKSRQETRSEEKLTTQASMSMDWIQSVEFMIPEVYKAGPHVRWLAEYREEEYQPLTMQISTYPITTKTSATSSLQSLVYFPILNTTLFITTPTEAESSVKLSFPLTPCEHVPIPAQKLLLPHLPPDSITTMPFPAISRTESDGGHVYFIVNMMLSKKEIAHMIEVDPLYLHHYIMSFLEGNSFFFILSFPFDQQMFLF
jgi:hypothetical protein